MADDLKNSNLINSSAIVAALLSAGAILFNPSAPLKNARPQTREPQLHETATKQTVDARMWQDPFGAVAKAEAEAQKQPSASCGKDGATRRCTTSSKLELGGIAPIILGVMASAAPYAEDEEARRRLRYAVLSALNRFRYSPTDIRHIGYVRPDPDSDAKNSLILPKVVPFEQFENADKSGHVFVLWLDEDMFSDRPFQTLRSLQAAMGIASHPIQIIGPRMSDTLLELIDDVSRSDPQRQNSTGATPAAPIQFYAYAATADNEAVLTPELRSEGIAKDSVNLLARQGVTITRTIATDAVIAKAIKDELVRRGAKPGDSQQVALISEWDTLYGRRFPRTLAEAFNGKISTGEPPPAWIHIRNYMRGLDGGLPQPETADKGSHETDSGKADKSGKLPIDERASDVSYGQGQYDYLRRLAADLKTTDVKLRAEGKSIRAIGVVGGDVYDKLLILRALKPQFPEAVSFTSDYDSLLATQSELGWTRNLVIASSFGPQLREELQGGVPPFRDVYETSAFLSALLALRDATVTTTSPPPGTDSPPIARNGLATFRSADGPGSAESTANVGAKDPGNVERWLSSARIYEIDRTGDILSLPVGPPAPPTDKPEDCRADLRRCGEVQPESGKLYADVGLGARLVSGLLFLVAACWFFVRLRGVDGDLKQKEAAAGDPAMSGEQAPPARPFTFERFSLFAFRGLRGVGVIFALALLAGWLFWPYAADLLTEYGLGEPMRLMRGVSVWPAILTRFVTLCVSTALIVLAWRQLNANLAEIATEMKLNAPAKVIAVNRTAEKGRGWIQKLSAYCDYRTLRRPGGERFYRVDEAWRNYVLLSRPVARSWRVLGLAVASMILVFLLLRTMGDGSPVIPARGEVARGLYFTLIFADVLPRVPRRRRHGALSDVRGPARMQRHALAVERERPFRGRSRLRRF